MSKYDFILDEMTFSFSSLSSYEKCPYGFLLNYILKKPNTSSGFAEFGTLCHDILEKYANGNLTEWELFNEYDTRFCKEVKTSFPYNKYSDIKNNYYNGGREYFETFEKLCDYKEIIGVEKQVNFKLDGHNMIGYIDLLVRNKDGKIEIIDHKSRELKQPQKKRWEDKTIRYEKVELYHYLRQLYLYSIPIIEEYGEYPEYLNFNCFRVGKWFKVPFEVDDYEETKKWAVDLINKIYQDEDLLERKENMYWCSNICGSRCSCEHSPSYDLYSELYGYSPIYEEKYD